MAARLTLVSWPYSASTPNLVESAVAMPETGSVRHAVKTAATSRFVWEPLRWSMDGLSLSAATMLISSPEYAKGRHYDKAIRRHRSRAPRVAGLCAGQRAACGGRRIPLLRRPLAALWGSSPAAARPGVPL